MRIEFTKMHGLGNDFIVFDAAAAAPLPTPAQWRQLADRHTGIGFDQALVLQPPTRAGAAVFFRIFNADGSEVEQCGNGARCVAALLSHRRVAAPGDALLLDSPGGLLQATVHADGQVSVNMGVPNFEPAALPLQASARAQNYEIRLGAERVEFGAVSMGNPHAVVQVEAVESAPVEQIGRALQQSSRFPRSVNVGFMQVVDAAHIRLRVFERGVGETRACGTGACAAAVIGRSRGLLGAGVQVQLPGGALQVRWEGDGQPVWLTGPAAIAFQGQIEF